MTREQIRKQLDKNYLEIHRLMTPDQFTLNKRVNALMKENQQLRNSCSPHEFVDGTCIWCDMEEYECK